MYLTRLYGPHRCHHCHSIPRLGWVYRCAQDEEERLRGLTEPSHTSANVLALANEDDDRTAAVAVPGNRAKNSEGNDDADRDSQPGNNETVIRLKPWMEEAILEGRYTPQQIAMLRSQRQNVNQAIATSSSSVCQIQVQNPTLPSGDSTPASASNPRPSLVYNPQPTATSELVACVGLLPRRQGQDQVQRASVPQDTDSSLALPVPDCPYQSCSRCRPSARDRSWQCLHTSHFQSLRYPVFSTDQRPLSNPTLVRRLGSLIYRPTPQTPGDASPFWDDSTSSSLDSSASLDFTETEGEVTANDDDAKPRLQRTIQRAIKGMVINSRRSSIRSKRSGGSGASSSKMDTEEQDLGTPRVKPELVDRAFLLACATSLPGKDGQDGQEHEGEVELAGGEVKVSDGVAVTEEGVDLGAADIIMQV